MLLPNGFDTMRCDAKHMRPKIFFSSPFKYSLYTRCFVVVVVVVVCVTISLYQPISISKIGKSIHCTVNKLTRSNWLEWTVQAKGEEIKRIAK